MSEDFFSRPRAFEGWLKVPVTVCALVSGALAAISVVLGLPLLVMFAMTGGGFDMVLLAVPLVFFAVLGGLSIRSMMRARGSQASCWA